jgi:hypothetical protein
MRALLTGRRLTTASTAAGAVLLAVSLGGTVRLDHTLTAATATPAITPSSATFVDDRGPGPGPDHGGHGHGDGDHHGAPGEI